MSEHSSDHEPQEEPALEPTLVEKWLQDQQAWQKMAMEYFDSMVKNDDFLTHIGNAMRGSLLAGKPYPGTEVPPSQDEPAAADDRIDEILHALHLLQGEMADLKLALAEFKANQPEQPDEPKKPSRPKRKKVRKAPNRSTRPGTG